MTNKSIKHTTEVHGEIIPIGTKDEDTFEYWVHHASKGGNQAVCWQNCYRIAKDLLKETISKKELQEKLEAHLKTSTYEGDDDAVFRTTISEIKTLLCKK